MKRTVRSFLFTLNTQRRKLKHLFWALTLFAWAAAGPVTALRADAQGPSYPTVPTCAYSPVTANVLQQSTALTYGGWISKLSGAEPVTVGGQPYSITTRFSSALFDGSSKAFDYLEEQVRALYPASHVEVQSYPAWMTWNGQTWKNLVVTIPGKLHPDQVVIMSAHFDSFSGYVPGEPYLTSPGADDNGSGSASLLETARLLREVSLDRTIKLIWFTGEEQGLWGSGAYTHSNDLSGTVGVVNLDMFGYDGDSDRCFEMHVSRSTSDPSAVASNAVGQCIQQAISGYGLDLKYDYFTTGATGRSDHASFWAYNVGAIEIGENFSASGTVNGCTGEDENHYYHTASDTFANMTLPYALSIHKAALAAVIDLAGPLSQNARGYFYLPLLMNNP